MIPRYRSWEDFSDAFFAAYGKRPIRDPNPVIYEDCYPREEIAHIRSVYELSTANNRYIAHTLGGNVVILEPDPTNGALVGTRLTTTVRVLCGLEGQDVSKSISATLKRLGESGGCTGGGDGGEPIGAGGEESDGGSDEARGDE